MASSIACCLSGESGATARRSKIEGHAERAASEDASSVMVEPADSAMALGQCGADDCRSAVMVVRLLVEKP